MNALFNSIRQLILGVLAAGTLAAHVQAAEAPLLNAAFDVSRELFREYNTAFVKHWKEKTGDTVKINQSHAGSSKQARAVIDGLEADIVSMNQVTDVDAIADKNLIGKDWRSRHPHNSAPFSSTIIFLVRKGNPKKIKDWDDLAKPGISVIVPNPKTSGNGRYSYLSAYGFALKKFGGDDAKARALVGQLFKNAPVSDTGGRGATTTFVQREIGDVLLTFESEVFLTAKELGSDKFEIIVPSASVEAEMPVAIVDRNVARHKTEKVANAYLEYLYSDAGQEIVAKNYFRPRSPAILEKYKDQFKSLELISVDKTFGGWSNVQKTHFADGGIFDQLQKANR